MTLMNIFAVLGLAATCCAVQAEELYGKCESVSSGDSFSLMRPHQKSLEVHLKGAGAPHEGEPLFSEAKAKLTELLLNKPVVVEVDTLNENRKAEGMVRVGDTNANEEMIQRGLCRWDHETAPNEQGLSKAETSARQEQVGLWAPDIVGKAASPSDVHFAIASPERVKQARQYGEFWVTEDSAVHNPRCKAYGKLKGKFTFAPSGYHNCHLCGGDLEGIRDYTTVETAKVSRVVDGDTVTIVGADGSIRSVSLYGCDAPEKGQKYGESSRAELERLLKDKEVFIVVGDKDLRKRRTVRIYADGVYVNRKMLEDGHGVVPPDCKDKTFHAYQRQAEKSRVGMWVAGVSAAALVAPWSYRQLQEAKRARAQAELADAERHRIEQTTGQAEHAPSRITPSSSGKGKPSTDGDIYVHGYYRSDGTYVRPHTRKR